MSVLETICVALLNSFIGAIYYTGRKANLMVCFCIDCNDIGLSHIVVSSERYWLTAIVLGELLCVYLLYTIIKHLFLHRLDQKQFTSHHNRKKINKYY